MLSLYHQAGVYHETHVTMNLFNSNAGPLAAGISPNAPIWVGWKDDGTNFSLLLSSDGANYTTLFTQAKSAGYLGASGYSNLIIGVCNGNASIAGVAVSLRAFDPNGAARVVG